MVINRQGDQVLISAGRIFSKGTDLVSIGTIELIENFRPDVESVESEDSVFIRMIRSSNTIGSDILLARRNMRNHITMVGNSLDFTDVVHNSVGKVKVSDSGGTISIKMDTVLVDHVAQRSVERSDGSESTAKTVTNKVVIVIRVHVDGLLKLVHEEGSDVIFVVTVEISANNGIFNVVEIIFHGSGVGEFLKELSLGISSTERNNESVLLSVDQKGVGKLVVLRNCDSDLVDKGVSCEIIAGITALPREKVLRRTVGRSGSSEHFESEGNVERTLQGRSDAKSDEQTNKSQIGLHKCLV